MRSQIRSLVRKTGYEVHRATRECFVKDAFADQRMLLGGNRVETIFDVGAHRGETAERYLKLYPEATIYSFEPFLDSITELRRKFENEPSVKPTQTAVSDTSGSQAFYVNRDSFTNSLLPALEQEGYGQVATLDVEGTTIDQFCE
ncbi:MAG TPA: FkbM family methyltransferase, partial [Blastocatellia bacterium]|nr:FkbM family methyltransferase [Blastocatellia bacterium]